jgi:hypothetical protein
MRKQAGYTCKSTNGIKERKKMREEGTGKLRVTCRQIVAYFKAESSHSLEKLGKSPDSLRKHAAYYRRPYTPEFYSAATVTVTPSASQRHYVNHAPVR